MTDFVQPARLIIAGPRDVPSAEADELVHKELDLQIFEHTYQEWW